eukprot:1191223-Prorocentrum_minimum.AAC.2
MGARTSALRAAERAGGRTLRDFHVTDMDGREISLSTRHHVLLTLCVPVRECVAVYNMYQPKGFEVLAFPCNQFGGQGLLLRPLNAYDRLTSPLLCVLALSTVSQVGARQVTFPVFAKIHVNGKEAHPLYEWLKTCQGGTMGDDINCNGHALTFALSCHSFLKDETDGRGTLTGRNCLWVPLSRIDFVDVLLSIVTEFLISKEGIPVYRYAPTTAPNGIVKDIETELGKKVGDA